MHIIEQDEIKIQVVIDLSTSAAHLGNI